MNHDQSLHLNYTLLPTILTSAACPAVRGDPEKVISILPPIVLKLLVELKPVEEFQPPDIPKAVDLPVYSPQLLDLTSFQF